MEIVINLLWSWLPASPSQFFYWTVALIFICIALKAIQLFQTRQKLIKGFRSFPGPPSHWLYGHVHMMKPEEEFLNVAAWTEKYPHCYPRWYGNFLAFLCINHPEYAKTMYSRGGKGLITLNGPKWQQHRKLLTPGFHYNILKPYVTLVAESVKEMLDIWGKLVPKNGTASVEMSHHISLMTLNIIMKCAFSYQKNAETDRKKSYIQTVFDLNSLIDHRIKTPFYQSDLIYWLSSKGRQFYKACKIAHHHTEKVIRERKDSLKNEKELEKILKKRHLDFLDILLCAKDENGNPLSDEDIRAEVDTFMSAGQDTTASGISWLFYCMAQNPEHQQRCREEIMELLGQQEEIQWDDLGKMTYSTMCIKESLRLYPPVPLIARELNSPVTFPDGRTLPKGFLTALDIYGLHRNPEVWDKPEEFNPLRFSTENSKHRHPYAFLPFATGPRNCIGQQFAMNEMKVALALTLLHFELLPDPANLPIPMLQIVIQSMNGIYLKLKALR
ncbi:cytochrome P450 4B1-like isoform X2 [Podarcis muralis]